jgi:uncharacterized protein (TIGR02996 family)
MNDRLAFLAAIDSVPLDAAPKGAFADWLDEKGEPYLAHAYRWAGRRGFYPYVSPKKKAIWWGKRRRGHEDYFHIPKSVFDALTGQGKSGRGGKPVRNYKSVLEAFADLAVALEKVRKEIR